jgi:hypothetical protein
MRIIKPVTITDSNLTSSTVPENDYSAWSSVTTYALGDNVISTTTHKIYESAQGSNLNNDPTTDDGTWWIEVSATNRWKAFDQKVTDQVTQATSLQYVIDTTDELINSLAFFNLDAAEVQVQLEDATDGEYYNETFDLIDNSYVIDWYTYFFEPNRKLPELLLTDLSPYVDPTVTITISETGSTAEVGQIIVGRFLDLGITQYNTSVSIEDFSRKERDTFGNPIIVQRAFAQRAEYDVSILTGDARRVQSILSEVRTTPVVWFAGPDTEQYGTTIYGYYIDFDINLATPSRSYATIEVEGLI